jgi:nucleotide-binding universal stress UspA family protein
MAAAQAVIAKPKTSFALKNILLATDFSAGSQTALKYARALAREEAAEIHALHVNAPDSYQLLSRMRWPSPSTDIVKTACKPRRCCKG